MKRNRSVLRNDPLQHQVYRGYLIRWSPFTVIKPDNKVWVEKDNAFICWANDADEAKRKIDEVVS